MTRKCVKPQRFWAVVDKRDRIIKNESGVLDYPELHYTRDDAEKCKGCGERVKRVEVRVVG